MIVFEWTGAEDAYLRENYAKVLVSERANYYPTIHYYPLTVPLCSCCRLCARPPSTRRRRRTRWRTLCSRDSPRPRS